MQQYRQMMGSTIFLWDSLTQISAAQLANFMPLFTNLVSHHFAFRPEQCFPDWGGISDSKGGARVLLVKYKLMSVLDAIFFHFVHL